MALPLIQAIRGMRDILPAETIYWRHIEQHLLKTASSYGYQELRLPIVEQTALFKRSIGEATDIVEKEMYTFADRNGDSLTLRPEGTAVCVRAGIEHGLLYNQIQRLWYAGPMFRHERPQKGRYRQFHQFGIEAFGMTGPEIEAEIILFSARIWALLGLTSTLTLQINSLGTSATRQRYRQHLVDYFTAHQADLDEDSQRRLTTNPLRILDSKNPEMQALIAQAPTLIDTLDDEAARSFHRLRNLLDQAGISYELNPRLVRGLDYYNGLVFEWVIDRPIQLEGTGFVASSLNTKPGGFLRGKRFISPLNSTGYTARPPNTSCDFLQDNALTETSILKGERYKLGAQSTVCAGGRYDSLVALLGGKTTPAVGFALGMERLVALLQDTQTLEEPADVYLILVGEAAEAKGLLLAETWRNFSPLRFITHCGGGSVKSQFKRADNSGARLAFIIGEDEIAAQTVSIKFLKEKREQVSIGWDAVKVFLASA